MLHQLRHGRIHLTNRYGCQSIWIHAYQVIYLSIVNSPLFPKPIKFKSSIASSECQSLRICTFLSHPHITTIRSSTYYNPLWPYNISVCKLLGSHLLKPSDDALLRLASSRWWWSNDRIKANISRTLLFFHLQSLHTPSEQKISSNFRFSRLL